MRKLAYIFGIALFFFGCTTHRIFNVSYDPIDPPNKIFTLKDVKPVLYIDPVIDNREFAVKQRLQGALPYELAIVIGHTIGF